MGRKEPGLLFPLKKYLTASIKELAEVGEQSDVIWEIYKL